MLAAVFVNIRLFPMHPGLRPEDCERCAGPLVSNRRPARYWNAEDGGENEFAHLGVRFGGSGIEFVPEVFQQRRLGNFRWSGRFPSRGCHSAPWLRLGRAAFLWVRIVDGRLRPLCRSLKITPDCTHAPSPPSERAWLAGHKPTKSAEPDAAAAKDMMPEKPIITSPSSHGRRARIPVPA